MNSNIVAYLLYLSITLYIIVFVGRQFHKNGRIFIIRLMHNDVVQSDNINNILLMAWYLFNAGYTFLTLRNWEPIRAPAQLVSSLSRHLGLLILILACTHYFNLLLIFFLSKKHNINH